MTFLLHPSESPYVQISRALIQDRAISPECRWLIIFLKSLTDTKGIDQLDLLEHVNACNYKHHKKWSLEDLDALLLEAAKAGYSIAKGE